MLLQVRRRRVRIELPVSVTMSSGASEGQVILGGKTRSAGGTPWSSSIKASVGALALSKPFRGVRQRLQEEDPGLDASSIRARNPLRVGWTVIPSAPLCEKAIIFQALGGPIGLGPRRLHKYCGKIAGGSKQAMVQCEWRHTSRQILPAGDRKKRH